MLAAEAAVSRGADDGTVLVATGRTFPDALAAGPSVVAKDGILLLVDRDELVAPTRAYLEARRGRIRWLRVAGGPSAVSDAVVNGLVTAAGV